VSSRAVLALIVILVAVAAGGALPTPVAASPYPALPVADGAALLAGLSAPPLAPGASEPFGFALSDPFSGPMTAITLSFAIYAFIPYPGNGSAPLPPGGTPSFQGSNASGSSATLLLPTLAAGARYPAPGSSALSLVAPASAPDGTFDIRAGVTFSEGSTTYRFESRGFFSAAAWANATLPSPNGSPTLNLTRLGVSGVLPETAVLVRTPSIDPVLYVLLGGALVLAGVGGYVAWRRGSGSRSGARAPAPPQSAPRTFGKSRTRDGD
jgi:hypothetical protein